MSPRRRIRRPAALPLLLLLLFCSALAQSGEQVETGRLPQPGSGSLLYRIRLLPAASFPDLPAAVREQLRSRACLVPQSYEAHQPENVIHGAFERAGASDWAVLCTHNQTTTLLVFFGSDLAKPAAIERRPDSDWIATNGERALGFAWAIDTVRAAQIPGDARYDHDAIRSSFLEQRSTLHYYGNGSWTTAGVIP